MSEDPEDQADDATGGDIGQGYPEENQPGTSPGRHTTERPDADESEPDAPQTHSERDSDPGAATGNPGAAGG